MTDHSAAHADDTLVIATRQSALALWQAEFIAAELRRLYPELTVQLLPLSTKGDQILDRSLAKIGGKGLFIKELEAALLTGEAHLAVHSMKDVPAEMPEGFALPAIGYRADPRDALVVGSQSGAVRSIADLPAGARVGSSSLRRQAQLLALRPDLALVPVRGNVNTRLAKLDAGDYDALLLAAAGLDRLGLDQRISLRLHTDQCLPAVGQAALGIECMADDDRVLALLRPLNSRAVSDCVDAERALSLALGASCSTPLGGYATQAGAGGDIALQAVLGAPDGSTLLRASGAGTDPIEVGQAVAQALLEQGAAGILEALEP